MPIGSSRCPLVPPCVTKVLTSGLEVNRTQTHTQPLLCMHAHGYARSYTCTYAHVYTHTQLYQLVDQEEQGTGSSKAWIPGCFLTVAARSGPESIMDRSFPRLSGCSQSSLERACSCLWQDEELGSCLLPGGSFSLF